jgi:hypothetical protein
MLFFIQCLAVCSIICLFLCYKFLFLFVLFLRCFGFSFDVIKVLFLFWPWHLQIQLTDCMITVSCCVYWWDCRRGWFGFLPPPSIPLPCPFACSSHELAYLSHCINCLHLNEMLFSSSHHLAVCTYIAPHYDCAVRLSWCKQWFITFRNIIPFMLTFCNIAFILHNFLYKTGNIPLRKKTWFLSTVLFPWRN